MKRLILITAYSVGRGGDVINFYANVKNIDNTEAIKLLSTELGLKNNGNGKIKVQDIKLELSEKRKIEIYTALEKYCGEPDDIALNYLTGTKRGLTIDTIKKFRLFSIGNIKCTIDFLLENYTLYELQACGLFNEKGRFVFSKHNLIIPYLKDDEIIYLRGRYLPTENNDIDNKYIGLYGQKAKRIFNIDSLKDLNEGTEIIICEGEFDTIRAEQAGYISIGIPGVNNYPENLNEVIKDYEIIYLF